MAYPVSTDWTVSGTLNKNGVPFSAGKVYADNLKIPNDADKSYIQSNYWDSFYKGLLAPERILLDLRRMEKAYLEKDCHGMEIIRPIAIFKNLTTPTEIPQKVTVEKTDGKNEYLITIQPGLFNADFEGHVNRRIRDVRLQIISGNFNEEFANVNAELALTSDTLFSRIYATSMALSNVGKFDFSFVDDKYSSFEGASLDEITEWTLRLSNIDCLDKVNAKVVLLISYSSIRRN